eukprot:732811_1
MLSIAATILSLFYMVQSETSIQSDWTDDFDITSGWTSPSSLGPKITTSSTATNKIYHGAYSGDDDSNSFETFTIARQFSCNRFSSVSIDYNIAMCNTEATDNIILSIDNNDYATTTGTASGATFSDNDITSTYSCISAWKQVAVGPISGPNVASNTIFTVQFEISTSYLNDFILLSDIHITCDALDTTIPSRKWWSDHDLLPTIPGWTVDPSPGRTTDVPTPEWVLMHGPYRGRQTVTISRDFYCPQTATVHVQFWPIGCNVNMNSKIQLYLDDILQPDTVTLLSELSQGWDSVELRQATSTGCSWWDWIVIENSTNSIPLVPYNTKFNVKFEMILTGIDEYLVISGPYIYCIPNPTADPTKAPSKSPTLDPTKAPSKSPTLDPTKAPSKSPTLDPTKAPSKSPISDSTKAPSESTLDQTKAPSGVPIASPTRQQDDKADEDVTETTKENDDNERTEGEIEEESVLTSLLAAPFVYIIIATSTLCCIVGCVLIIRCKISRNKAIARQMSTFVTSNKNETQTKTEEQPSQHMTVMSSSVPQRTQGHVPTDTLNANVTWTQEVGSLSTAHVSSPSYNNPAQFGSMVQDIQIVNHTLLEDVIGEMLKKKKHGDLIPHVTAGGDEDEEYDDDDDVIIGMQTKGGPSPLQPQAPQDKTPPPPTPPSGN